MSTFYHFGFGGVGSVGSLLKWFTDGTSRCASSSGGQVPEACLVPPTAACWKEEAWHYARQSISCHSSLGLHTSLKVMLVSR
jgi:hypothetical protein